MRSVSDCGLKFVSWGSGLGVAGLITGYFPLGHYLMKDSLPSCPAAPVHGHTILLSFVGMTIFALVYLVMPRWSASDARCRSPVYTSGSWSSARSASA
jgi:hypothetical protein